MDEKQCERMILKHLKAIVKIYKRYNPKGAYLTLTYINNSISTNNEYWGDDCDKPIDVTMEYENE